MEKQKNKEENEKIKCTDKQCPFHGSLRARGRSFRGYVTKKFPRRVVIVFEKIANLRKYERQMRKKTKIHARLPDCMKSKIEVGDYIEIRECRPLSKIIHFVVINKIRGKEEKNLELNNPKNSNITQDSEKIK